MKLKEILILCMADQYLISSWGTDWKLIKLWVTLNGFPINIDIEYRFLKKGQLSELSSLRINSHKSEKRGEQKKRFNQTENNFICCGDIKIRKTETRTNRSLSSQLDKTQARVSAKKKSSKYK